MSLYELKNIKQSYDERVVLDIEHLVLDESKIIGFFGPNGSGKSTMFSLLSFVNEQKEGDLTYLGINSKELSFKQKQSVVLVPQNPYLLKRSVYENIVYGLKLRGLKGNLQTQVDEALTLVGLDASFAKRNSNQLSGGEAQRVALASRLILKPKVLILDEPTTGVDVNSAQLIKEAVLIARQKYNTSILISSHDHNWLNHICDQKVVLFNGSLVQSGSINLLFAPWKKDTDGNLVKEFLDGQKLVMQDSKNKKSNSVALVDSENMDFFTQNQGGLRAVVKSISLQNENSEVLVEFYVGGIIFNKKIPQKVLQDKPVFPGNEVFLDIKTKNVDWL